MVDNTPEKSISHDALQQACFTWHWNTFPHLRGLLHANINNASNSIKGALNRSIGVVKGVADLEYLYNGKMFFIELKIEGDRQSEAQKEFENRVTFHKAEYHIVCNRKYFQHLIEKIHATA